LTSTITAPQDDLDRIHAGWVDRMAKIWKELALGFLHQEVWTAFRDEVQQRRPNVDATFLVSYTQLYVAAQLLLIRRLADPDSKSRSLRSLSSFYPTQSRCPDANPIRRSLGQERQ
jgi:hypothetical protein